MRTLYLGISGVLHPSASTYELVNGRSPWADGHVEYEAVPWLTQLLEAWPDVQIVVNSTLPRKYGLAAIKERLGAALGSRVVGHTYEDLTTKIRRSARSVGAGRRKGTLYSADDYWRMNKSGIVAAHVEWLEPNEWVAVDDEDILWASDVREHLVLVNGCEGLAHPTEQDKLASALKANFSGYRA